MSVIKRQNALFVAEDWIKFYEAIQNVDFRAYEADDLMNALITYLRETYPTEFNDWIVSSEFITILEILVWLHQNIAYRVELNARENFIGTAERRDSIIRLAQNVGYKINRVRPALGFMKVASIRTTQSIIDSNGIDLSKKTINWGDTRDEDWFERFVLILNSAFLSRTQFSYPLNKYVSGNTRIETYLLNSLAPTKGSYRFASKVNGKNLEFELINGLVNENTGAIEELAPAPDNIFSLTFKSDGGGLVSSRTGFYMPFKQGSTASVEQTFTEEIPFRTITLPSSNINETDIRVQELDSNGNVVADWVQVNTLYGEGVSFNPGVTSTKKVFEVDTLENDRARIRFGDGVFGEIPSGSFRIWYRVSNPEPIFFEERDLRGIRVTIPYVDKNNTLQNLVLTLNLGDVLSNGVRSETNLSIRNRVGRIFYTQNRMITGQDYNNLFLRDNRISKVKVVNRSFAGQSKYNRLYETTGLYDNVRHYASDGRLFKDTDTQIQIVPVNSTVLTTDQIISKHIEPLLKKDSKLTTYRENYDMQDLTTVTEYLWRDDGEVAGMKTGHIEAAGVPQKVGSQATGELSKIIPGSIIRTGEVFGPVFYVISVTGDGTEPGSIALGGVDVNDGDRIMSVLPPLRTDLNDIERTAIKQRIDRKQDFGIRWDQDSSSWKIVDAGNLDVNSDFDLSSEGTSWLVRLKYNANTSGDFWQIFDRGIVFGFESSKEIDFIFSNEGKVIDPQTGKLLYDQVTLLSCNEAKNSPNRLNIENLFGFPVERYFFKFCGDGTKTEFETTRHGLDPKYLVVYVDGEIAVEGAEYTVSEGRLGTKITFFDPPTPQGSNTCAEVLIIYSTDIVKGKINRYVFTTDGTTRSFALNNTPNLNTDNVIVTLDGVTQKGYTDFFVTRTNMGTELVTDEVLGAGVVIRVHTIEEIENTLFTTNSWTGDGTTSTFQLFNVLDVDEDEVLVTIDGVVQAPNLYTIDKDLLTITLNTPVPVGAKLRIWINRVDARVRVINKSYTGDGTTTTFSTDTPRIEAITDNGDGVMVFWDGIHQAGPKDASPSWSFDASGNIVFTTPPVAGTTIHIFGILAAVGIQCDTSFIDDPDIPTSTVDDNTDLDKTFKDISFLGKDVPLTPVDTLRHPDGYVNKNGLIVLPVDRNNDTQIDFPFIFKDIVIDDGISDIVMWRKVTTSGAVQWEPLDLLTKPRGHYGDSVDENISNGASVDTTKYLYTDVFHDPNTKKWFVADESTGNWIEQDASNYKTAIGRAGLKFTWTHYASSDIRIDPSISNVMDVFILTSGYYGEYLRWLRNNDPNDPEPVPETSTSLRNQFASFFDLKPVSDSLVFHPVRIKPLFGPLATPELQAYITIRQSKGSTISESDLKLRIIAAMNRFFSLDNWELGESLYISELISFIHKETAPHLQSISFSNKNDSGPYGSSSAIIRAEPDQLLLSATSVFDIIIESA